MTTFGTIIKKRTKNSDKAWHSIKKLCQNIFVTTTIGTTIFPCQIWSQSQFGTVFKFISVPVLPCQLGIFLVVSTSERSGYTFLDLVSLDISLAIILSYSSRNLPLAYLGPQFLEDTTQARVGETHHAPLSEYVVHLEVQLSFPKRQTSC